MRSDIVAGAIFPDYELSDHAAKRRKLSELQGQHRWFLFSAAAVSAPKTARKRKDLFNSIVKSKLVTAALSRSAPTTLPKRMNTAPALAPTGLFSLMWGVWSKKIWTSPNTPIPFTIP